MVKKYVGGGNAEVSEEGKRQLKYQQNDEETNQAYKDHYKKETADNEATSKAVSDGISYVPRQIGSALSGVKNNYRKIQNQLNQDAQKNDKARLDEIKAIKDTVQGGINKVKNIFTTSIGEEKKAKGGVIKDLKKAGFYDAKKDKAKRLSIINKVTTKPQRIEMVDKLFSAQKMAKGGSASARADGCAIRGKTKA